MSFITSQVSRRCSDSELTDNYRHFLQAVLGSVPEKPLTPGKFTRFGGRNKPLWALLFKEGDGGVAGDWRTGSVHVWKASSTHYWGITSPRVQQALAQVRRQREREQRQQWTHRARKLQALWADALPVTPDSPVAHYLKHRLGLTTWPLESSQFAVGGFAQQVIRYAPALPYFDEDGKPCGAHPAMLALLTSPRDELVAIHRTWLTPEGHKADVPGPVKKLTPTCGPLAGAGIALFSAPDERGRIGVAEGIETALAASLGAGLPVCAAYSANNLAAWCWPTGTRRLVIFADHDQAGQKAAQALLVRAQAAGVQAIVRTPSEPGLDWCDVWAQRDAKEVQA